MWTSCDGQQARRRVSGATPASYPMRFPALQHGNPRCFWDAYDRPLYSAGRPLASLTIQKSLPLRTVGCCQSSFLPGFPTCVLLLAGGAPVPKPPPPPHPRCPFQVPSLVVFFMKSPFSRWLSSSLGGGSHSSLAPCPSTELSPMRQSYP